jgi:protein phosphatase
MRRANNQDSHAVVLAQDEQSWHERGHLFMVADGMGAHAAGELASKLAVDGVPHLYHHYRDLSPSEALRRSMVETNSEIHRRGQANPDFHAMGTTASVLVVLPQGALMGHVGDSRVYRLRGKRLDQLTFDHSLQWELRNLGRLPEDSDLARAVPKNVITRSLGPNADVAIDLEGPYPLEVGDTFLLCSDGLTGQVDDYELAEILANLPPDEAIRVLVDLANLRGGPDNITVIIAKIAGPGMVADESGQAPTASRSKRTRPAVGLAPWVVSGVCLFLAVVLWIAIADQRAPAIVSALAGVVAAVVGVVLLFRGRTKVDNSAGSEGRHGNGPHAHAICKGGDEFMETLSGVLDELRDAAQESNWDIEWSRIGEFRRAAAEAAGSGDYSEAVRHYARAISFMMDELRRQQSQAASDSSIDY